MARRNHRNRKKAHDYLNRHEAARRQKTTFLIVCEGRTEVSYFYKFKIPSIDIKPIATGTSTVNIVKEAIKQKEQNDYDQVWCVFDKDDNKDLNNAIKKARINKIKVAYSNQAFEYWLLLHFDDHQGGAMDRKQYANKLNVYLRPFSMKYETRNRGDNRKAKNISQELFDLLQKSNRQGLAIKRAKRLDTKIHTNLQPSDRESNTTVYLLVAELLKHI